jgi:Domain of unknown function (DUF4136)
VRLTKHMTSFPTFLFAITYFARWNERRRRRKAIEMRLATLLALVLKFPVTTALVYNQEVHFNYERGANFSAYKTYQWVDTPTAALKSDPAGAPEADAGVPPNLLALPNVPSPPLFSLGGVPHFPGSASDIRDNASEDQLINQEIKRAVDEQLAQKGLTKVDKSADLHVGYHAAIRQEQSLYVSGMGWGGGWDGSVQGQTSSVPIGTIVVDLYDPAQKQLIWRGDATKTIDLKKDPDKNYRSLQKAMAKLFKNYPPTPKK